MQVVVAVNGEAGRTVVLAHPSAQLPYSGRLTLTGGDRLVLRGEGELVPVEGGEYRAISAREGGSFVVDLLRPNDRPMLDLEMAVPPPFTLKANTARARWGERIELSWDRADAEYTTSIAWSGPCSKEVVRLLASDTGSYTVNTAELPRPPAECALTLAIVRTAPSKGSRTLYATAKQTRTALVMLGP
jgi:hypothetical protein